MHPTQERIVKASQGLEVCRTDDATTRPLGTKRKPLEAEETADMQKHRNAKVPGLFAKPQSDPCDLKQRVWRRVGRGGFGSFSWDQVVKGV